MATGVTIPGSGGSPPLIFSVTGSSLVAEAQAFANAIIAAQNNGTLVINHLTGTAVATNVHSHSLLAGPSTTLNEILPGSGSHYVIPAGSEYTFAQVGAPTTITGSAAGGDTVLAGAAVTYVANAGLNNVAFIAGDNTYIGGTAAGDTITGGAGHDSIYTGTGFATVLSGSGQDIIVLKDTASAVPPVAGGFAGDVAYLGNGQSTVHAAGLKDVVITGTAGQTILGESTIAGSTLAVVVQNDGTNTGPGNDLIIGGAATTAVFDSVGGNTIFGGAGGLLFIGETTSSAVYDTIDGGQGQTFVFGNSNNSIVVASASTAGGVFAIAGSGNETLNGANALSGFTFFGRTSTDTVAADATNTLAVGGSATNTFVTGSGNEVLIGGTGTNAFYLTDNGLGNSHITVFDFANGGNDLVSFAPSIDQSMISSSVSNGNLTLTLADKSTIEFVGITSLTGHIV